MQLEELCVMPGYFEWSLRDIVSIAWRPLKQARRNNGLLFALARMEELLLQE